MVTQTFNYSRHQIHAILIKFRLLREKKQLMFIIFDENNISDFFPFNSSYRLRLTVVVQAVRIQPQVPVIVRGVGPDGRALL